MKFIYIVGHNTKCSPTPTRHRPEQIPVIFCLLLSIKIEVYCLILSTCADTAIRQNNLRNRENISTKCICVLRIFNINDNLNVNCYTRLLQNIKMDMYMYFIWVTVQLCLKENKLSSKICCLPKSPAKCIQNAKTTVCPRKIKHA